MSQGKLLGPKDGIAPDILPALCDDYNVIPDAQDRTASVAGASPEAASPASEALAQARREQVRLEEELDRKKADERLRAEQKVNEPDQKASGETLRREEYERERQHELKVLFKPFTPAPDAAPPPAPKPSPPRAPKPAPVKPEKSKLTFEEAGQRVIQGEAQADRVAEVVRSEL